MIPDTTVTEPTTALTTVKARKFSPLIPRLAQTQETDIPYMQRTRKETLV